ncbi:hypothetical protein [Ketobacter sp.]|uniref:hypothetical protein n=1 Tax=Ketobacter sp. TaxID=2083498 RepID=UPI000F14C06F|nr:hypothetical protein [Ketobacter sp.]RLU01150.1 MAG: hypothetical protein D9N14_04190 [Ketobacter sp.]
MYFNARIQGCVLALSMLLSSAIQASTLTISSHEPAMFNSGLSVISLGGQSGSKIELASSPQVAPAAVQAGQVVYESVEFVDGYDYSVVRLDDLAQGTYQLTLTDFAFPEALTQLGVTFTTATETLGSMMLGGGSILQDSITFDITEHDSYYLAVFGRANGASALGLYGVELKNLVSHVPLPASLVFLLSGLAVLSFSRLKNKSFRKPI